MSEPSEPSEPPEPSAADPSPPAAPVLPDGTTDDSDVGWGEPPAYDNDQRLLDERPPHHDRH